MDSTSSSSKFIDIEEVIRNKNPKLLKALPMFLIRYLKRVIHQDDLNDIIENNRDVYGVDFVRKALQMFGTVCTVKGVENVPKEGRFIFASNHPLGGLDGLILISEAGRLFPNVKFVVNDLLMNVKNLESVFVPVNKHGRQSADYARIIDDAYASDDQILYFPAGLCSRKIKGQVIDLVWHKSFISKAVKYKRDIIPVYVEGRNSNFFYGLANFRKKLGIKVNIEMLYLVDEMFKQKGKSIQVVFGAPVSYTQFDSSKTSSDWATFIREKVYAMKPALSSI